MQMTSKMKTTLTATNANLYIYMGVRKGTKGPEFLHKMKPFTDWTYSALWYFCLHIVKFL